MDEEPYTRSGDEFWLVDEDKDDDDDEEEEEEAEDVKEVDIVENGGCDVDKELHGRRAGRLRASLAPTAVAVAEEYGELPPPPPPLPADDSSSNELAHSSDIFARLTHVDCCCCHTSSTTSSSSSEDNMRGVGGR